MATLHPIFASRWPKHLVVLTGFILSIIFWPIPVRAEPNLIPQPALLPHQSPLCDSNLVACLDIDNFAAHASVNLLVLPRTDLRDSAVVFPYGLSMGVFGRFAGGISTDYSFWQVDGKERHQHGPLRLNLTALIWPLLPLRQAPAMTQEEGGGTHFRPARHLRVGLHYEHQLRIGPFDGANSLGFLTDLAALRLVATKVFGPIELTASLGAIYDWRGAFATGEAAIQVGLYLPFFRAMKVYGEALSRGGAAYIKRADDGTPWLAALLSTTGLEPIRSQNVLGLGLSFRPQARVDFGVSVQMGLDGLAPSAVLVRALVLSVGETYQGRAATPVAQLAADATVAVAKEIKEYIASLPIDPILDENCIIRDYDGSYMGKFGKPTPNGYYCEEDGFRVPINYILLRDKGKTMLCRQYEKKQLRDCLLERHGSKWVAVHRPSLDGKCEMYDSDGTYLGRLGTPTADGTRCRYPAERSNGGYGKTVEYQEQPIGEPFHTDTDRSRVCLDPAMRRCFMKAADGRKTLAVEGGERFAKNYVQRFEKEAAGVKQQAEDIADGKVGLTTIRQAATEAAQTAVTIAQDPKKAAADTVEALQQAALEWEQKTPEQKQDSLAGATAGVTISAIGTIATGGAGRLMETGAGALNAATKVEKLGEVAEDVAKAGKKLGKAGEKAGHAIQKAEVEVAEHAPPRHLSHSKEPHRNRVDSRDATLYEKYQRTNGELTYEKTGVTHHKDPRKRYTKAQIGDGDVKAVDRGPRHEMLKKERKAVETSPGPGNREPWAGKDTCE